MILSTTVFLLTPVINAFALFRLALTGSIPALPHRLDLEPVTIAIWGVLVSTILEFNARWLPIFAGFGQPGSRWLLTAYGLSLAGIVLVFLDQWGISSFVLVAAAGDGNI